MCLLPVAEGVADSQCIIDNAWKKTYSYRNSILSSQSLDIDRENNNISLLPSVSASTSQNINSISGVGNAGDTSLGLSVSQSLYSGGTFFKTNEIINNKSLQNRLMEEIDRIDYILSVYDAVSDLNYRYERLGVYKKQLKLLSIQLKKNEYEYNYGNISGAELEIFLSEKTKTEDIVETELSEIRRQIEKLHEVYYVDVDKIKSISASSVLACKRDGLIGLKKKYSEQERDNLKLNFEKSLASSLSPAVDISVNAAPKNGGMVSNANSGFDHTAGLSVSIPLSGFFSYATQKKQYAVDLSASFLSEDNELSRLITERNDSEAKLKDLERKVIVYKKILTMEKKKVDYAYFRYTNKTGSLIEYQNELNAYNQSQLDFKLMESNLEGYRIRLSFYQ